MNLPAKTDFLQHKPHPLAASWSMQGIVGPGRICKESFLSSNDLFRKGIPCLELMMHLQYIICTPLSWCCY